MTSFFLLKILSVYLEHEQGDGQGEGETQKERERDRASARKPEVGSTWGLSPEP